ncbi:MAG: hypothetical protein JNK37_02900 [Verrucomicrobiales bacterium]|nr:hypothetical protein [Verrucomicrobiales bacterium]
MNGKLRAQVSNSNPPSPWRTCPLCGRAIPPHLESRHHLTPKLKGGKHGPIAILHTVCHGKIHSVFTEGELARDYHTIERLLTHPEIVKFVHWVSKRPPDYRSSNRPPRG